MQNSERIKIAVIGCGNMGMNHIRVLKNLSSHFDLTGVFDQNVERAQHAENTFFVPAYANLYELLAKVDAVSIVVPPSAHKTVFDTCTNNFLNQEYLGGERYCDMPSAKYIFIEKPLALDLQDALAIKTNAEKKGILLMVGHIERFNPVVTEIAKVLRQETLIALNFQRLSHFDLRVADVDVVKDLMIHDLDVLNSIISSPVKNIQASGSVVYSKTWDYVHALITFENEIQASLIASRITEAKVRELQVHTKGAYIVGDYINRSANIFRRTNFKLDVGYETGYRQESIVEKLFVPIVEPLAAELEHFASCIKSGTSPITDAKSGIEALTLAEQIVERICD